jgi:outer membrane protein TolC
VAYIRFIPFLLLFFSVPVAAQIPARLGLREAERLAIARHPALRAASSAVDAERGRRIRGLSPSQPELGVSWDFIPRGSGIDRADERHVEIRQSFPFPLTLALTATALSRRIDAAEAASQSAVRAVLARTRIAYAEALAARERLRLSHDHLTLAEDFARTAGIRDSVGEGTRLERLTALTERTEAAGAVENAEAEFSAAFVGLASAIGVGAATLPADLTLSDSLTLPETPSVPDELLALASTANPRLREAEAREAAAASEHAAAWSGLLPDLSIGYAWQREGPLRDLSGLRAGISLPLWFALDQRGRIRETGALAEIASSELQAARIEADAGVRTAFLDLRKNERLARLAFAELLPQAREVYRTARAGYDAGETSYVELLQARRTLLTARRVHIDALLASALARIRLDEASGLLNPEFPNEETRP